MLFQINWKVTQPSRVPGVRNPPFGGGDDHSGGTWGSDVWLVLKLNLLQAGAGLDELLRTLLT